MFTKKEKEKEIEVSEEVAPAEITDQSIQVIQNEIEKRD
tara:strand:- start:1816 stop:1932 length:117 start_codon:yes stop_codon:yes gene_type:complete